MLLSYTNSLFGCHEEATTVVRAREPCAVMSISCDSSFVLLSSEYTILYSAFWASSQCGQLVELMTELHG
jgi:hypothetical protein